MQCFKFNKCLKHFCTKKNIRQFSKLPDIFSHRTVFGIYLLRILQILTSAPAIRVKMAVHVRTSSTDFPVPALNTSMERFVNSVTIKTKIKDCRGVLFYFIIFQTAIVFIQSPLRVFDLLIFTFTCFSHIELQ